MKIDDLKYAHQLKLLLKLSNSHVFQNTSLKYYTNGISMLSDMIKDLKSAKKYIFLEYFIFEEGHFLESLIKVLKEKVKEGVEIKLIYDDIGCMMTLPGDYVKELAKYGIDCVIFSKLKGQANNEFNNRSHRKIMVIDGVISYTGGINIGDEYLNLKEKYGHWKDNAIRLYGEATKEMTKIFLFDYGLNSNNPITDYEKYFSNTNNNFTDIKENNYVIPFGDGPAPIYNKRVSKSILMDMFTNAKKSIYITTPYLIIDNEISEILELIAYKGIDVKIIIPNIPDKKLVYEMTKVFSERLMKSGVKIYKYMPGFIHQKTFIIDNEVALIGTINLDYRSLVHHFENGVWIYSSHVINDIIDDYNNILTKTEILEVLDKKNIFIRMYRALLRLIAVLM